MKVALWRSEASGRSSALRMRERGCTLRIGPTRRHEEKASPKGEASGAQSEQKLHELADAEWLK